MSVFLVTSDRYLSISRLKIVFLIALNRCNLSSKINEVSKMQLSNLNFSGDYVKAMAEAIGSKCGLSSHTVNELKDEVSKYLVRANYADILKDLTYTKYVIDNLAMHIKDKVGGGFDIDRIIHDFAEVIYEDCTKNYETDTDGPIGWIINHFKSVYFPAHKKDIMTELSRTGYSVSYGDESLSLADLQSISVETEVNFDFDTVVRKIYDASKIIYRNSKSKDVLFYDLMSKYKLDVLERDRDEIVNTISKDFRNRVKPEVLMTDENISSSIGAFSLDSKKMRNIILASFDKLITGGMSPTDLHLLLKESIINDFMCKDPESKHRNTLYAYIENEGLEYSEASVELCLNSVTVQREFYTILLGYSALGEFVAYLKKRKISVFDVPSDIFRDPKMIVRFNNLDDYLLSYNKTKELMDISDNSGISLMTNDELYLNLLKNVDVNKYKLSMIKDIIDKNEKDKLVSDIFLDMSEFKESLMAVTKMINRFRIIREQLVTIFKKFKEIGFTGIEMGLVGQSYDIININKDGLAPLLTAGPILKLKEYLTEEERAMFSYIGEDKFFVPMLMSYLNFSISALSCIQASFYTICRNCRTKLNLVRVKETTKLLDIPKEISSLEDIHYFTGDSRLGDFKEVLGIDGKALQIYASTKQLPAGPSGDLIKTFYNLYVAKKTAKFRIYDNIELNYELEMMCWLYLNTLFTDKALYNSVKESRDDLPCLRDKLALLDFYKDSIYGELRDNGVSEVNSDNIISGTLYDWGLKLLGSQGNMTRNFERFLTRPDVTISDENCGYVYRNGRPYFRDKAGIKEYLHSSGYWISEFNVSSDVSDEDTFN